MYYKISYKSVLQIPLSHTILKKLKFFFLLISIKYTILM